MIEQGILAPGAQKLSGAASGHNETYKGEVRTGRAKPVTCHVKLLEPKQLANEMLCGLLARQVGLNAPEGYLVHVYRDDYPDATGFQNSRDNRILAYGSASQPYQTLYAFSIEKGAHSLAALSEFWRDWPSAMVFDEWIANGGRDLHDALLDTAGQGWLIDHEQSFRGSDWQIADLYDGAYTSNQILETLGKNLSRPAMENVFDQVENMARVIQGVNVTSAIEECGIAAFLESNEVNRLEDFLERRKNNLVNRIKTRLVK